VRLTVDGKPIHAFGFGRASTGSVPRLQIVIGQPVTITVSIEAAADIYVGELWLVVNSYPFGLGPDGPMGNYALLTHRAGPLTASQEVSATWTPETLAGRKRLDLTIAFAVGHRGVSGVLAHFDLTP
jgi:hypothetical protein